MTEYTRIETTGHINRAEVLGVDPISGNSIIELYAGPQGGKEHRIGAFSISPELLGSFFRQVGDALYPDEEETTQPM